MVTVMSMSSPAQGSEGTLEQDDFEGGGEGEAADYSSAAQPTAVEEAEEEDDEPDPVSVVLAFGRLWVMVATMGVVFRFASGVLLCCACGS